MRGYTRPRPDKLQLLKKARGKPAIDLVPIDISFPLPGLSYNRPRDQIAFGAATDTDGIRLYLGVLMKAPGWVAYLNQLDDPVLAIGQYTTSVGAFEIIAITEDELFKAGAATWTKIPKAPAGDLGSAQYDLPWWTQVNDKFLFSDGIYQVMAYAGGASFGVLDANCPAAKTGVGHEGRLILGNTIEGGTSFPQRVRWNAIDNLAGWTVAGSGYVDLTDRTDLVVKNETLLGQVVVLKERSIVVGKRTGQFSPAYDFVERDSVNGTLAPHAVINRGTDLIFIGPDNIYSFDLNKSQPIGDQIVSEFFSSLNPNRIDQCRGYYNNEFKEVRICTPTGLSDFNDFEWIWNTVENTWVKRAREVKSVGIKTRALSVTWDDLGVPWDSVINAWNSPATRSIYATTLIGTRSGQVFEEDGITFSANGTAYESFYEFGDLQLNPSRFSGVSYVELRHRDTGAPCALRCDFTRDGGNTWVSKTVNLRYKTGSDEILRTTVFQMIVGERVSMRLYNNSATARFRIVGIRAWATPVGTYNENT